MFSFPDYPLQHTVSASLLNCALCWIAALTAFNSRQAPRLQISHLSINDSPNYNFDSLLNLYVASVKIMFPFHSIYSIKKSKRFRSLVSANVWWVENEINYSLTGLLSLSRSILLEKVMIAHGSKTVIVSSCFFFVFLPGSWLLPEVKCNFFFSSTWHLVWNGHFLVTLFLKYSVYIIRASRSLGR